MGIFSIIVILPEMMIQFLQGRHNDSIDADISIPTYTVGFIYYGNEAYDDDTVILTRDKLCCFDEWATKAKMSDYVMDVLKRHNIDWEWEI